MEELARSDFTKAGELANARFAAACLGSASYPEGTAFIAADARELSEVVAGCARERRPVSIIHADGLEVLAVPPRGPLSRARAMLRSPTPSRAVGGGEVAFPPGYRIELRSTRRARVA